MAKQLAFYIDSSICTGCKVCQIACQDKNNLPPEIRWRKVLQYGGGNWFVEDGFTLPNNVYVYSLSLSCNHCEEPKCVENCPTGALYKREKDGIVALEREKCIGCRYCVWSCPYGAPQFIEEEGKVGKCDMCVDLVDQGQNPACVDACVMRAIKYGDLNELRAEYNDVSDIEPLPPSSITKPSLVITPHKHAQPSGQGSGHILNLPEEI